MGGTSHQIGFRCRGTVDSFFTALFAGLTLILSDGLFMEYYNSVSAQVNRLKRSQFITAIRSKGASTAPHIAKIYWFRYWLALLLGFRWCLAGPLSLKLFSG